MRRAGGFAALPLFAGWWAAAGGGPVVAIDPTGASVVLSAPAQRIISLAPAATELLLAAGAGRRVVGVLSPVDWSPEASRLLRVGDVRALEQSFIETRYTSP